MPQARRPYELKQRARRQDETRRRIVDATVALHREVGPARTTVAEIARRAGVTRVTVYNHFPDDASLFGACSARFIAGSPPPDPARWLQLGDPAERLRSALGELYGWYRANEAMLENTTRDAALLPALAEVLQASEAQQQAMGSVLMAGRRVRGARRQRVAAAIGLAIGFGTWQQLVRREGLDDAAAVDLMARAVGCA